MPHHRQNRHHPVAGRQPCKNPGVNPRVNAEDRIDAKGVADFLGLYSAPIRAPFRRLRYQRTSVPDGNSLTQPTSS
jgi:hypothetical protein